MMWHTKTFVFFIFSYSLVFASFFFISLQFSGFIIFVCAISFHFLYWLCKIGDGGGGGVSCC